MAITNKIAKDSVNSQDVASNLIPRKNDQHLVIQRQRKSVNLPYYSSSAFGLELGDSAVVRA